MSGAARNRLWSLAAAAGATGGLLALIANRERRLLAAELLVMSVGYGHLLGAARPWERIRRWTPPGASPWVAAAFCAAAGVTAYVAYRGLLAAEPRGIALLFALSAWHTWENDRALGAAYAHRGRLGPTRASPWAGLALAGGGLAAAPFLLDAVGGTLEIAVFVPPTVYHLASWLVLTVDRLRWLREDGFRDAALRLRRRLIGCHAAALLPAALSLAAPESAAGPAAAALLSPPIYLFATALHILDTSLARGRYSGRVSPAPRINGPPPGSR